MQRSEELRRGEEDQRKEAPHRGYTTDLLHAIALAADIRDRDGRAMLFGLYPFLLKLYADGEYQDRNAMNVELHATGLAPEACS